MPTVWVNLSEDIGSGGNRTRLRTNDIPPSTLALDSEPTLNLNKGP